MAAKIISISMAKGGVGKSVTTVNLGAALSQNSKRVLLIDNDQQGSLTTALGHNPGQLKFTLSNIILSVLDSGEVEGTDKAIIKISDKLDLIPANSKLAAIQNRLISEKSGEGLFGNEGDILPEQTYRIILTSLREQYDFIILDCAPSLSMLTINALVAADSVLLPLEAHYLGYEALEQILDIIKRIRAKWNPDLKIEGILVTKYQSRTLLCRNIKEMVEKEYGQELYVFPDPVPYSIKAAEQTALGVSIFQCDSGNAVAEAYSLAAKEVLAHV